MSQSAKMLYVLSTIIRIATSISNVCFEISCFYKCNRHHHGHSSWCGYMWGRNGLVWKLSPLSSLPPRPTHLFLTLFRMGEGKEEGKLFFGGRRVKTFSLTFSFSRFLHKKNMKEKKTFYFFEFKCHRQRKIVLSCTHTLVSKKIAEESKHVFPQPG